MIYNVLKMFRYGVNMRFRNKKFGEEFMIFQSHDEVSKSYTLIILFSDPFYA